ncbi:hypothetical protein MR642_04030 [bacterium]|nr:hypothetical protein [bacterium]
MKKQLKELSSQVRDFFLPEKGYKKEEDAGFRGLPPSVLTKIGIRAQRAKSGFFVLTFRRLPCPTV